ncbi:acyl carrier protein [Streptomyces sp. 3N207]|uniref:acyl carrier protein n=1 Tax=Streptomyces sp. 3N207 TaxID=3457417 RepID=UPI003FD0D33E
MTGDLEVLLQADLKLPAHQLKPHASLEDAGFDSLAIVELSVLLGERFGIDVTDADIRDAATLDQLDRLIQRKRDER